MEIEKTDDFYYIKLREKTSLIVPLNQDLNEMIKKDRIQISVLNRMIEEHLMNIKAVQELKKYKDCSQNINNKSEGGKNGNN